jgi:hypothetical protein
MCEAVGHPVQTLKRTRVGPISDRRLRPGEWRELKGDEIAALKKAAQKESVRTHESVPAKAKGARRRARPKARPKTDS